MDNRLIIGGIILRFDRVKKQPHFIPGGEVFEVYNVTDRSESKRLYPDKTRTHDVPGGMAEYYNLEDHSSNNKEICVIYGKAHKDSALTKSMHFTVKYPTGNSNAHFEYMGSCNTRYYN
jgi:hypothetical protein